MADDALTPSGDPAGEQLMLIPAISPPGAEPVDYPNKERIPAAIHGPESSLAGIVVCVTGLGVSGYPMAVHLAERGAEVIVVDADDQRDESEHETILRVFDVDERGLDRLDRAVLSVLCERFNGGPVGLSTLAVSVGEEPETVEEVAEPFLVREGLMTRTPRGRIATQTGWQHIGLTPPDDPALFS